MQYQKYHNKILKIAIVLKAIKRFRWLIIACFSAISVLTAGFLGVQGIVYDTVDCPTVVTYGDAITYEAKAVMKPVRYEFSADSSFAEIGEQPPILPGKYYVRAVAESAFNTLRYGDTYSFEIVPREVEVKVVEGKLLYGNLPTVSAPLVYEDSIECSEYKYEDITKAETKVSAIADKIKVTDKSGADVTSAYKFIPVVTPISFDKRDITVTVSNTSGIYDDLPLSFDVYELSGGTLAFSGDKADKLIATFKDSITEVGEKDNVPTIRVVNTDNLDVSIHYNVTLTPGKLTVEKRPLKINVESKEFTYDGAEHNWHDYSIDAETPLVSGHSLVLTGGPKLTDKGSVTNLLTFNVTKGSEDVSANYSIFIPETTLKVNARPITVETDGNSWIYDGEAHVDEDIKITSELKIVDGQLTEIVSNTALSEVGDAIDNVLQIAVKNSAGADLTDNYDIEYVYGKLEITQRSVSVVTHSSSFEYDGKPHSFEEYDISVDTPLVEGHYTSVVESASVTEVKDGEQDNALVFAVKDSQSNDVTKNYNITISEYGKIHIKPREMTLTALSADKIYDGQTLRNGLFDTENLAEGQSVSVDVIGEQTEVGVSANKIVEESTVITSGETPIDPSNYSITYVEGTLEVKVRPITVITPTQGNMYNGLPQDATDCTVRNNPGDYALVDGHSLDALESTFLTNVWDGSVENVVKVTVLNEDGKDIGYNYDIGYENGTMWIDPRPVTAFTGSYEWTYDGEWHSYMETATDCTESPNTPNPLVDGHTFRILWCNTYVNEYTESPVVNDLCVTVMDADENDVGGNYAISYDHGELSVKKRPVNIITNTNKWYYDALEHSDPGFIIAEDSEYGWVDGHEPIVVNCTTIMDPSSVENVLDIIVMCGDDDLTHNYDIIQEKVTLTIEKRTMTITTASDSWTYDNEIHFNQDYTVESECGLLDWHKIVVNSYTEILNAGTKDNVLEISIVDVNDEDADYTDMYDIDFVFGTLEVKKRPVTIKAESAMKEYDGTPLMQPKYTVENLRPEHTLEATTFGSQTDLGKSLNVILADSVTITGKEGSVIGNYEIILLEGELKVVERIITITSGSAEKVYDGTPLTDHSHSITSKKGLFSGHKYTVDVIGTITDAGSTANIFDETSVLITDASGKDVGYRYGIIFETGTLTVTKRKITVQSADDSKKYDETPLISDKPVVITEGTLAPGQTLNMWTVGEITDIGTTANTIAGGILDANENDVIYNYDVTYNAGTLEILPHAIIEISTEGATKEYDGEPLTNPNATYTITDGALLEGHTVTVTATGSQTEIGFSDNTCDITIVNSDGVDVSKYYLVVVNLGTLEVLEPGEDVSHGGSLDNSGDLDGGIVEDLEAEGKRIVLKIRSNITGKVYLRLLSFGDYNGHGFNEAVEYGELLNGTYGYGYLAGNAMKNAGITEGVLEIHSYTQDYLLPYYLGMGPSDHKIQQGDAVNVGDGASDYSTNYYIYQGYGADLVGNVGELSAEELAYREFVHSQYLKIDAETLEYMKGIISEQGFDPNDPELIQKVAEYIQNAAEYNLKYDRELDKESNVVIAFLETYKEGICQHYAASATMLYRALGIPARYTIGYTGDTKTDEWTEVLSKYAHAWTEVYVDGVGWISVEVTGGGPGGGEDGEMEGDGEMEEEGDGTNYGGSLDDSGKIQSGPFMEGGGGKTVILKIKSNITGSVYFRLVSFGDYNGQGFNKAVEYDNLLYGAYGYGYLSGNAMKNAGITEGTMDIVSYTYDYLLPYYLGMGSYDYNIQKGDAVNVGDGKLEYSMNYYSYKGDGTDLIGYAGELSEEELAYREFVHSQYLQIDSETLEYLNKIIEDQNLDPNDPKVIQRVAAYIQNAATYNLQYDRNLDSEPNIVIAFLDKYKEGICQHYAASATMLYRALGIPARYTLGYTGGTIDGQWTEVTAPGHAWTEVYVDGVGWIPVEVTGGGPGGGMGGGGGGGSISFGNGIVVKPVDLEKEYDGTPLEATDVLDLDQKALATLVAMGYTYTVDVEGSQLEIGDGVSEVVYGSFRLYDPSGKDVTDAFVIVYKPGTLKVTKTQIIVNVYGVQKYYDGKPLEYLPDDYYITKIPEGLTLILDLAGSVTDAEKFDFEAFYELPMKVIDEYGNDVTDDYYVKFVGEPLRVDPRKLVLSSMSHTKEYDGKPLADDTVVISQGSLVEGHTLIATATGTITVPGSTKNTIDKFSVKIVDEDGNDVSHNYVFEFMEGTLTVTEG